MSETPIVKAVQLKASEKGYKLFRDNIGRLQTKDGRWVQYGLCVGAGDLIGWRRIRVTPEMVGKVFAQFVSIEVKTATGTLSKDQQAFMDVVNSEGGHAVLVRSESEL